MESTNTTKILKVSLTNFPSVDCYIVCKPTSISKSVLIAVIGKSDAVNSSKRKIRTQNYASFSASSFSRFLSEIFATFYSFLTFEKRSRYTNYTPDLEQCKRGITAKKKLNCRYIPTIDRMSEKMFV